MSKPRPRVTQYREDSREEFGKLRVVHIGDLLTIETQISVQDDSATYGMRLGWRRGPPPLTGELVSLHLPQSKILVRVSRVTRTCVCCAQGVVHIHVAPVAGVTPDEKPCKCVERREMQAGTAWRDFGAEAECRRKNRAVLRQVSDILEGRRK